MKDKEPDKEAESLQSIKSKEETALGTQPVGRLLFKLALPAITAQIINVLYNMVDRMFIGHIAQVGCQSIDWSRQLLCR